MWSQRHEVFLLEFSSKNGNQHLERGLVLMRPKSGIECSRGPISLTQEEALSFIRDAGVSQIVLPIARTLHMPTVF